MAEAIRNSWQRQMARAAAEQEAAGAAQSAARADAVVAGTSTRAVNLADGDGSQSDTAVELEGSAQKRKAPVAAAADMRARKGAKMTAPPLQKDAAGGMANWADPMEVKEEKVADDLEAVAALAPVGAAAAAVRLCCGCSAADRRRDNDGRGSKVWHCGGECCAGSTADLQQYTNRRGGPPVGPPAARCRGGIRGKGVTGPGVTGPAGQHKTADLPDVKQEALQAADRDKSDRAKQHHLGAATAALVGLDRVFGGHEGAAGHHRPEEAAVSEFPAAAAATTGGPGRDLQSQRSRNSLVASGGGWARDACCGGRRQYRGVLCLRLRCSAPFAQARNCYRLLAHAFAGVGRLPPAGELFRQNQPAYHTQFGWPWPWAPGPPAHLAAGASKASKSDKAKPAVVTVKRVKLGADQRRRPRKKRVQKTATPWEYVESLLSDNSVHEGDLSARPANVGLRGVRLSSTPFQSFQRALRCSMNRVDSCMFPNRVYSSRI